MMPLHAIGEYLRTALLAIPLWSVRWLFVGSLLLLMLWVMRLPASATQPPGGARGWGDNLKVGAGLALLLQILIYMFL
ncbi:MAG: hypothetical protein KDA45_14605 [Planctomycetales bacterium]|nr:hypothetical protein [Planctomycetales bacterium]